MKHVTTEGIEFESSELICHICKKPICVEGHPWCSAVHAESKEPDWLAIVGEIIAWTTPARSLTFFKLHEFLAKHTPREKTAEEKLAEVRDALRAVIAVCAADTPRGRDLRNILDLCK